MSRKDTAVHALIWGRNARSIGLCPSPRICAMPATVSLGDLKVDKALYDFVNNEVIPEGGLQAQEFWKGFAALVRTLAPRNAELLRKRDELQAKIDAWHRQNPGPGFDRKKYKSFLGEIGYLVAEGMPFAV